MKKGFTLIELLAVIVILAIIALIAVPIVLNIINDSKESSLLRSAEFYLDAAEYAIADAFLYHGGLDDKEYPIDINGDICKIELDNQGNCPKTGDKSNTLKVEVNGDKPTGGTITIESGNISNVSIILDEKTIIKNPDGELVYQVEKPCTLAVDDNSNGQIDIGDKIICSTESFYVVSNDGTNIEMLTEKNINVTGVGDVKQMDNAGTIVFSNTMYWSDGSQIKEEYKTREEGVNNYYVYDSNSPIYPHVENYKKFLSNNINVVKIELLSYTKFMQIAIDEDEYADITGPNWLLSGPEQYWLGSIWGYEQLYTVSDWSLRGYDDSPCFFQDLCKFGVRPVITISKEDIKISN